MEQNILPTTTDCINDYDDLAQQRRTLENEIAQQEERLTTMVKKLVTPQGIIKNITGYAINNAITRPSLFSSISNGWQWIRLAMRLIKRYI